MTTTQREIREQLTTARLNDRPVQVHQPHRRWTAADYAPGAPESEQYEAALVTVTAPVSLSAEDAAAVLFYWNWPAEDLDDDTVRSLIAGTVVAGGSFQVEALRCELGERAAQVGAEATAYLAYCRQRVAAVFGPPVPAQSGRALVGVR